MPAGEAVDRALAVAAELAALPERAYATNKLMTRERSIEVARADVAAI